MAVVSVQEIPENRAGEWSVSDGRSFQRCFLVQTNSSYDGPNLAISALGINRGDQYLPNGNEFEWDLNSYCNKLSASPREDLWWEVSVEYGPYSSLFAGGGPTQNPLLMPIDVSWTLRDHEVVADVDIYGNPIVNTAGDPFDPPIIEDDPRPTLTVVRNEAVFNYDIFAQYRRAINSDNFAGYAPLMSRVVNISPKSVFQQDVGWYTQTTYEFEFNPPFSQYSNVNGYRRTVLSQGMRAISVVSGKKYHVSFRGVPATEPVMLSQSGAELTTSYPPYWCVFQTKPELPFAVFNFDPQTLLGQRAGFNWGYGNQGS